MGGVEHSLANEPLHSFIVGLDVQARNMTDLPIPDYPSLLFYISEL